jgi:TPR repeat protein
MKRIFLTVFLFVYTPSIAAAENVDAGGTLNPDEMSLQKSVKRARNGDVNMVICSQGYLMTKGGEHEDARAIFQECAKQGWTGTMTWMSYMDSNGFGADYNPDSAADWDKRAADAGDPIGSFNYGLNLLHGHGVTQDLEAGKRFIDQAADQGLKIAKELQAADYDPMSVTPDADEWKYVPRY